MQTHHFFGPFLFVSPRDIINFDSSQTPTHENIVMKSLFSKFNQSWVKLQHVISYAIPHRSLMQETTFDAATRTTTTTMTTNMTTNTTTDTDINTIAASGTASGAIKTTTVTTTTTSTTTTTTNLSGMNNIIVTSVARAVEMPSRSDAVPYSMSKHRLG